VIEYRHILRDIPTVTCISHMHKYLNKANRCNLFAVTSLEN